MRLCAWLFKWRNYYYWQILRQYWSAGLKGTVGDSPSVSDCFLPFLLIILAQLKCVYWRRKRQQQIAYCAYFNQQIQKDCSCWLFFSFHFHFNPFNRRKWFRNGTRLARFWEWLDYTEPYYNVFPIYFLITVSFQLFVIIIETKVNENVLFGVRFEFWISHWWCRININTLNPFKSQRMNKIHCSRCNYHQYIFPFIQKLSINFGHICFLFISKLIQFISVRFEKYGSECGSQ